MITAGTISQDSGFQPDTDEITKPLPYDAVYEEYFAPLAEQRLAILELGTSKGDATKIFATFFRNSRILSLGLHPRDIDFSGFENVRTLKANLGRRILAGRVGRCRVPTGGLGCSRRNPDPWRSGSSATIMAWHGMVGFVEFLVDETAGADKYKSGSLPRRGPRVIECMHVYPGQVIPKKCP